MTSYEKTLTEANAQCHQKFQDILNDFQNLHHIEQELQNQAHDDEEQDDGS